tara:strand:- start:393 stop:611 length:219 start_codon:yes stop_codon:yes gene_type:complete
MPCQLINLETGQTMMGTQPEKGQAKFDPVRHKYCSNSKRVLPRSMAEQIEVLINRIDELEEHVSNLEHQANL